MLPPARAGTSSERRTTETVEAGVPRSGERAPEPAIPSGGVIAGRYQVLGVLGNGGFAVVYRAFDRELRREVALKVLRADRLTPEALGRLRREAALARDAVSARLVRIFDVGRSGDAVFLTMEIVDGGSLDRRLADGPLPVDEAVRIATQALAGLEALHALRIVHRDVKPGNVLLTAGGEVKLADFGLALQLGGDESRLTRDGSLLGTLQYLSPEQALAEEVDPRSDLYSLGVVLFEMLTGRLPHEGRSALGTLLGHLREEAIDVRTLRPDVPPWLAAIVARLLARRPEDRYPSAAAALADLEARTAPVRWFRAAAIAGALLLSLLGGGAPAATRFSHLVERGDTGTAAIGRSGEVLWTEPLARPNAFALAHLRPKEGQVLVGILDPGSLAANRTLSVLDPDTKGVLRKVPLPDGRVNFPGFAPTFYPTVEAVDLDGDGYDEILVDYRHQPMYPSYLVLYEPRIEQTRLVFLGSGHHHFAGAADLDGDGHAELLIAGINNLMGWYTGIAAVRVVPPVNQLAELKVIASTPDRANAVTSPLSLLWYTLGPRERFIDDVHSCRFALAARQLDCAYDRGIHLRLGFDGFSVDRTYRRPFGPRQTARELSYRDLREVIRLLEGNDPADALPSAEHAVAEAEQAEDDRLRDLAGRLRARTLVAAGRRAEGEEAFERLAHTSEAVSDVCYDAGKALHLAGDLPRAVAWYRRGLGRGGVSNAGRNKWELLEGEVLALAEVRRFAEARAEIERYTHLYAGNDGDLFETYRRYLLWREGETPPAEGLNISDASPDFLRYFRLELRVAAGSDPRALLSEIEAELPKSSEAVPELRSLESVVLSRLGRTAEARRTAREGYQLALQQRFLNTGVRALFDVIAERARLVGATGG